jgi:hypothetical protein
MDLNWLDLVADRWEAARATSGGCAIRSVQTRPAPDSLLIEVESRNTAAQIVARRSAQSLEIVVSRFKDSKTLFEGHCRDGPEAERRLLTLVSELCA